LAQRFGQAQIVFVFLVINTGIHTQLIDHVIALVFAACDAYDAATPCLGQSAIGTPHRSAGGTDRDGFTRFGRDDFDQAKSELHWLEYAMTGAAFIGERFRGDGPYQMVREGVDGMLARGRGEWYDAMKKLTRSKDLREQLAGAARERVLKEYHYKDRAKEWADAFKWAAENKGKGAKIA
jgi:hypothetical protein